MSMVFSIALNRFLSSLFQFGLYLNSVRRFMERSKAVRSKLKLEKIFDLQQSENPLVYTLMGGFFDLNKEVVFRFLVECVAITFLIMQTYRV